MNIKVLSETELQLSHFNKEGFEISLENDSLRYSAVAMFTTSLARCTFAVLAHYAMRMEVITDNIELHMHWGLTENPTKVSHIAMDIYWPEVPEKRISSVERASHKCTISNTINDCLDINTRVFNASLN